MQIAKVTDGLGPDRRRDTVASIAAGALVGGTAAVVDAYLGIPGVGGVLGGVVGVFIPNAKLDRVYRFAQELAPRFQAVEDDLDQDFVRTEEFAAAVEDVLDRITRRKNDEKLAYFAAALANAATSERPDKRQRERLLSLLDELQPAQLLVLAALSRAKGVPAPLARPPYTLPLFVGDAMAAATAGVETDDLALDLRALGRLDLVGSLDDNNVLLNVSTGVEKILTPLAEKLIAFAGMQVPMSERAASARPTGRRHKTS